MSMDQLCWTFNTCTLSFYLFTSAQDKVWDQHHEYSTVFFFNIAKLTGGHSRLVKLCYSYEPDGWRCGFTECVHCIYIFIYRPYCLKIKTKNTQDKSLFFFWPSEPFYDCTYKRKKYVYLQIAATYSLLPMPLKSLRLYCFSLDAVQLFTVAQRCSFIIYCLNECPCISSWLQLYVGFRARW